MLTEEGHKTRLVASECAGICDDEIAQCYCNGTKGRIEAPAGSPPGTLYLSRRDVDIRIIMPTAAAAATGASGCRAWRNTAQDLQRVCLGILLQRAVGNAAATQGD